MCVYVMFISKDYFSLCFWGLMIGYVALIVAFLCPESPQWLFVHGMRKEGIEALNKIAKFNRAEARIPEDAVFDEDPNPSGNTNSLSLSRRN